MKVLCWNQFAVRHSHYPVLLLDVERASRFG